MGTNYFAVKKEPSIAEDHEIHIGKSSIGGLFHFHECDQWHTFHQFEKWLEDHVDTGEYVLLDEYDERITKDALLELIERKQNYKDCKNNPENFAYGVRNVDGYRFDGGWFR